MEPPIAIDRVERARGHGDEVRLRLSGRWLGPDDAAEHEALLVIQLQGRRHRFAANRTPAGAEPLPGNWQAEFTIPSWAVPDRPGQAAVWVGNSVVAVGPPGSTSPPAADSRERPLGPRPVPEVAVPASPRPELAVPASPRPEGAMPAGPSPQSQPPAITPKDSAGGQVPADPAALPDTPRSGPLADLLFKETVTALHAELERRSGEAAQLRGALADARSELDARAARQAGLETAHGELRRELEQLMGAVARQRQDFDERLGSLQEELERAREQAAMATAVRDDAEAELTRAREAAGALSDQLRAQADAERRTAQEAAALRAQLAAAQISRDAAISEAGGLRAELERLGAELTVVREQMVARGGDLGEAQRLLADARALTEQLRDQSGS
jgi:hypothetical protein